MEAITAARVVLPVLAAALGCVMGIPAARADIYTWTDATGRVNISNLAPPEGVRVTSVLHEAPKPAARSQPPIETAPQPDAQALADRVRQLEWDLELARRQPPPTVIYAAAPPQPQYPPQPIPQYSYNYEPPPAPSYGYGCDPSWLGCGFAWSPWAYPANIVVLRTPGFHRHAAFRGMNRPAYPQPVRPHPGALPGRPSPGGMHRR